MDLEVIKLSIRDVPDFPSKGILFKDLTTVFKSGEQLKELTNILYEHYKGKGLTKIVGIESRGFIMGPILAEKLGIGFVPVRKKGKLPADTIEESYEKEYGIDTIQIHTDALTENDVVLLHDDLLATGGTMKAAENLVKKFNVKKIYINFLVELDFLEGRKLFGEEIEVDSIIHF
ncbi:adenine phosphoribosyltransferase [Microbacter margulisiae]|uniref:Adenine phosphoribosyltransferase n=1 Tax=Microbacter margulisiae TaxID=1350067 RepID=A0A7W5DU16_9PORP|nr:adenine phosphoribosyltransferase [Microbacter margulisiae]MBB3188693.1 adenine phosphoribosyltransferase [Microbacter margulisiae]